MFSGTSAGSLSVSGSRRDRKTVVGHFRPLARAVFLGFSDEKASAIPSRFAQTLQLSCGGGCHEVGTSSGPPGSGLPLSQPRYVAPALSAPLLDSGARVSGGSRATPRNFQRLATYAAPFGAPEPWSRSPPAAICQQLGLGGRAVAEQRLVGRPGGEDAAHVVVLRRRSRREIPAPPVRGVGADRRQGSSGWCRPGCPTGTARSGPGTPSRRSP